MAEKERIDFCTICRKETEYVLKKRNIKKIIKDVEYMFNITIAICRDCGEEMSIPGLILGLNVISICEKVSSSNFKS